MPHKKYWFCSLSAGGKSLTRALQALEARKLILRVVDAGDRRKSIITISRQGIDTLQKSVRNRESWLAKALVSTLTPTKRDMLRIAARLIERVADADD